MKIKVAIAVAVVVVLLALLPLSNLFSKPSGTALTRTARADAKAVHVCSVLEERCAYCHVPDVDPPFYAKLPVASAVVSQDVREALGALDFVASLFPEGKPPAEPALAKLEREVVTDEMPPARYLALHWNGGLSAEERDALVSWIKTVRAETYAPKGVPVAVAELAVHPLPASIPYDSRKAALGEKLYHDTRLSGDDSLSCASCHDLTKGGTDQLRVSTGIRGQKGGINAPTTLNAAFHLAQFWDGRAATLQDQAGGPPLNPVEMGGDWTAICARLDRDPVLAKEFKAVYPDGFSACNVTEAIAEYEKTLITPNSKFDRFLAGDTAALTPEAKHGWELFQSTGCTTCHVGKVLGGQSYEVMGRHSDYFTQRGALTEADNGRFNATKNEADRRKFKVPTLRNVALTYPYFHDGSAADLKQAVRVMADVQHGVDLAAADADAIVKFLESLTGELHGKPL